MRGGGLVGIGSTGGEATAGGSIAGRGGGLVGIGSTAGGSVAGGGFIAGRGGGLVGIGSTGGGGGNQSVRGTGRGLMKSAS